MNILFLEEAQVELDKSIKYYDLEYQGLGEQFLQEILNTLDRIDSIPHA